MDGQSRNVKNLLGNILEGKQHLEQRMSVQRSLWNQLFDQFLEGKILVGIRLQREGTHLANYIAEGLLRRNIPSEN